MTILTADLNPSLDLTFERDIDLSPAQVWAAWTTPAHILHWFTPAPWQTVDCEMDVRPGGIFRTTMRSPEGQEFPNTGCFLEVIPQTKLVWTNLLTPGYRPANLPNDDSCDSFGMTATISLAPIATGTRYTALVVHGTEAACNKHRGMGFQEGWGKALDQLIAHMKNL